MRRPATHPRAALILLRATRNATRKQEALGRTKEAIHIYTWCTMQPVERTAASIILPFICFVVRGRRSCLVKIGKFAAAKR